MKKLKHSKYKNTGILFEMLVRKLTSETLSSDKSNTIDIIKKYFGRNTELSKELSLYNLLLKEQFKSEAHALDFIRSVKSAHNKLNKTTLQRQRYNLVKEISDKFVFEHIAKIHISNYKTLASINLIFEYNESDNPKQIAECRHNIAANGLLTETKSADQDNSINEFMSQPKDVRLLAYKFIVDSFNEKYTTLNESQKQLLNTYITNVNDTTMLRDYIQVVIPKLKTNLAEHAKLVTDSIVQIKVKKLGEMLCNVESIKVIKESHILSLLRYMQLIEELNNVQHETVN
jgi:hypothetical protein